MENHSDVSPNEFELHNSQVDILTLPIYTRTQLLRYNGQDKNRIFVAIKGYIYDVTSNRRNYGIGKSYHKLVGKDVSRLLGLNRLQLKANESDTGLGEHKEEWDTSDFSEKQLQALDKWVAFFNKRYRIVGIVVHHQTRK